MFIYEIAAATEKIKASGFQHNPTLIIAISPALLSEEVAKLTGRLSRGYDVVVDEFEESTEFIFSDYEEEERPSPTSLMHYIGSTLCNRPDSRYELIEEPVSIRDERPVFEHLDAA